jgi:hypothetical protein
MRQSEMEKRLESESDYPCGACTWSCTAGTPGCRPCARTRSRGGTPGSRRRRRRRRRPPLRWCPRRRRRSGTPDRRRASPSVLMQKHSALRSQDPRPARIRVRNAARIRNSPRRPRRRPWRAQATQLRREVGSRARISTASGRCEGVPLILAVSALNNWSGQGWGKRTAHRTDAGTEAARQRELVPRSLSTQGIITRAGFDCQFIACVWWWGRACQLGREVEEG